MPAESDPLLALRTTAIVAGLRACRLFSGVPPADLEAVAVGCATRTLAKGEILFREREPAEGFYVVRTGAVSVFRVAPDGREQIICVFRPPESFAEVALATVETYPANAAALEPSQVILVRRAPFRDLICRKPELALRMLVSMSVHLRHLVQTLHDFKGRQIEARLADWLLHQSPAAVAGCPAVIELAVTKKVLAGQLGVTSETLSRTFARFRDEGLIKVAGPRVHVLHAAGLGAYARGER
jgi:CRP/FNR family transcriptional regulator, dissimilatory nitrate respiration regulator